MAETVNIRELNDLIASKSNFVNMIRQGMDQTIVGRTRFFIQVQEPKKSHTGDIRWPI